MPVVLDLLPRKDKLKIVDVGCGNGFLASVLSQLGHDLTAFDDSEEGIRIARKAYPNVHFLNLSIYDKEIVNKVGDEFDVVISSEVIEHLYYPRILLQNAKKILKPDGRLILTTVYHGYFKNLALAVSGKMDRHFTAEWDGGHIKFFSVKTLTKMVQEEGFRNIQFKFGGRVAFLWKSMILCATPE
jgi:2-polyprenyl-3-methyl-5-hydroxy-6-metoxy-1,4-benzoquinol methylase